MNRNLIVYSTAAIFIGFLIFNSYSENQRNIRLAKMEAEQSVSILPDGVEQVWKSYIAKRLSEEIQREGQSLKVRTTYIGASPSYSYISLNQPYQIDCNGLGMGISVNFGAGEENGLGANITGDFSSDHANEPELNVNPESIASKNLDKELCRIVAEWMAGITIDPLQSKN